MPTPNTSPSSRPHEAARRLSDKHRHHAWKRFWCRRDKSYSLGDGGFLANPESELGRSLQPDAISLEQLDATGCLVLLGEPGIGKSTTLMGERDRLAAAGSTVYTLKLLWAANREELHQISEAAARSTADPWFLLLDGLDEGIARNANLPEQLAEVLERCDRTKLRLRISCRALGWPSRFEDQLKELWPGSGAVEVYELLPLR